MTTKQDVVNAMCQAIEPRYGKVGNDEFSLTIEEMNSIYFQMEKIYEAIKPYLDPSKVN